MNIKDKKNSIDYLEELSLKIINSEYYILFYYNEETDLNLLLGFKDLKNEFINLFFDYELKDLDKKEVINKCEEIDKKLNKILNKVKNE